jgi:uncharacterized protein
MESNLLQSKRVEQLVSLFLVVTTAFMAFLAINEIRAVFQPQEQIGASFSVQGTGSVFAVPDVARITFAVEETAESAEDAQAESARVINAAIDLLDDLNIEEKDVKTTSYNVYPEYAKMQPCYSGVCPEYERTITGYTATQRVEIKVRDTEAVGEVLTRLGSTGVSNLSGPNFSIDDPEALYAEARSAAIADARAKAKVLAKDLGVRAVRVVSFWEDYGPYYPYAENRAYGTAEDAAMSMPIPEIPLGEDEITVTVNVSYEIR